MGHERAGLSRCIARLIAGTTAFALSAGEPAFGQQRFTFQDCADLYGAWERYESPSTLHTGQKARAEFALECDCSRGRFESGMNELRRLLQRGLVPIPASESSKQPEMQPMRFYLF